MCKVPLKIKSILSYSLLFPALIVGFLLIASHSCCTLTSFQTSSLTPHIRKVMKEVSPRLSRAYVSTLNVLSMDLKTRGSAVVIESLPGKRTFVLTAFHVVDDMNPALIPLRSCSSFTATDCEIYFFEVANTNKVKDLALLRSIVPLKHPLVAARVASEEPLKGDTLSIIGNPGGLHRKITKGILSHIVQTSKGLGIYITDAAIDFGNSGGGFFNEDGELIGIAHAAVMNVLPLTPTISLPIGIKHGYALGVSLPEIHSFLKSVHLQHLYE